MPLLVVLLFLGSANIYEARVVRVIDGDTIRVAIAIWPDQELTTSIRVRGIDTPELRGKCKEERALAQKAKAFVQELLPVGARVTLSRIKPDKYGGRYDADVAIPAGSEQSAVSSPDGSPFTAHRSLADALIGAELARAYGAGARSSWCPALASH